MESRETELGLTRVRIQELRSRAAELGERNRELSARKQPSGSFADDLVRAQERAALARTRAIQAHERAATAYLRSAAAHEAVADRHEMLAAEGFGDPDEHRRLASEHREMCAEDLKAGNFVRAFLLDV